MSSVSGLCGGCSVSLLEEDEARGQPCVCVCVGGGGGEKGREKPCLFLIFSSFPPVVYALFNAHFQLFLRFTPAVLLMFLIATTTKHLVITSLF